MAITLVNRAKMNVSGTPGTGAITLGTAESGYQTFAAAGVSDGDSVRYTVEDGTAWEIGVGVYTATGTSLSRTPSESSSGGSAISLTSAALVFVTATERDINVYDLDGGNASDTYDSSLKFIDGGNASG